MVVAHSHAREKYAIRVPDSPTRQGECEPICTHCKSKEGGHYGGGFQPTVMGVHRLTVRLDDAAKEGLVHAMRFLNLNHADAARWLLTNAQIPEPPK